MLGVVLILQNPMKKKSIALSNALSNQRPDGAKIIRDVLMEAPWDTLQSFDFGKVTSLSATVAAADAGKRVADVERPGLIRIAAIRTGRSVRVAANDTILAEGDEINAIVAPEAISEFATMFQTATPRLSA